ncbi:MAG: Sensor histidine kinase [uncultured Sphingomonadaceae bacterium]|uniref:Sensor histidine kinase n=1 Tax=uncultured Sphingomonadaceae bacterium TaxID=169976 RepID=A0A6J4S335_9SPHN|nr:MAG: Sensor histidine kinase [uncultured Sphingomonadaceae bacterium]
MLFASIRIWSERPSCRRPKTLKAPPLADRTLGRRRDVAAALDTAWPAIDRIPIASVISNPRLPDNPLVAVNDAFCELTGYRRDDVLGRNCRFLAGPTTEPWLTETIRQGVRDKRQTLVEIRNYKRDGTPFRNAVLVAPVFGASGAIEYFLGSQVEIHDDGPHDWSARRHMARQLVDALSPRQKQVLQEIAAGYRSKEISHHLHLSEKTVKMHRALLLNKLGTSSTATAIRIAVEAGL